jgi:hypothetical protein
VPQWGLLTVCPQILKQQQVLQLEQVRGMLKAQWLEELVWSMEQEWSTERHSRLLAEPLSVTPRLREQESSRVSGRRVVLLTGTLTAGVPNSFSTAAFVFAYICLTSSRKGSTNGSA